MQRNYRKNDTILFDKIKRENPRLLQDDITFYNSRNKILVCAHRGYSSDYPENTLLAFKKALELGVDGLEIDVVLSKDGVPVLMHDIILDRTTSGTGAVYEYTLEQLKTLDAGRWKNDAYAGEKIPTLEELLVFLQDFTGVLLNVEIKFNTTETVDKTLALLQKYNMAGRFVILSFDASIIEYAHNTYGVPVQGFPKEIMRNYSDTYSIYYSVVLTTRTLSKERVLEFCSRQIEPWSSIADDAESTRIRVDWGIKLLLCNNPVHALKYLKENGLR